MQIDGVLDPALALERERHIRAVHLDMLVAHGGQAVALVFARVLSVADAYVRGLHDADDGGENLLFGQARKADVVCHALADARQGGGETRHALVLVFIASCARGHRGRWLADDHWQAG